MRPGFRSGREAFQPGTRVRPSASLKRLRLRALGVVRVVVAHGVKLLRLGRGCGGRCGVSAHSIEVAQIVSRVRPAYQGIKYDIYIMC